MVQEQLQRSMSRSSRHTRELARRLGKLTEVQAAAGWGLILLVFALLGVIYLNQSSKIAAVGRHVQTLQYELSIIERANAELEREIAQAQSISRIEKEAERMGFVSAQPGDIEYMVVPIYPPIIAPDEPESKIIMEAPTVETMREGLWLVIESGIRDLMEGESLE